MLPFENVRVKRTEYNSVLRDYVTEVIIMQFKHYNEIVNAPEYINSINDKSVAVPLRLELIEKIEAPKKAKEKKADKE